MDSPRQSRPRPRSDSQSLSRRKSSPPGPRVSDLTIDRYESNRLPSPPRARVSDPVIDRYEPKPNPEPVTSNSRRPLYADDQSDRPPRSSTLPYRPRPDNPETNSTPARTHPASEPPATSYPLPQPPPAPAQEPNYTTSPTLYHNPFQDLSHVSPRPISGPDPKFESLPPTQPYYPGPTPNYPPPNPGYGYGYGYGYNQPNTYPPPTTTAAAGPPPPPTGPTTSHPITTTTNTLQPPAPAIATTTTTANNNNNPTLKSTRDTAETALRELLAVRRQQSMLSTVNSSGGGGGGGGTGLGINGVGVGSGVGMMSVNGVGAGAGGGTGMGMLNGNGKVDQAAAEVETRRRLQTGLVLMGLRGLQARVEAVVGKAEGERWRRFAVGGVV